MLNYFGCAVWGTALLTSGIFSQAALVTNPGQPITEVVRVNPIIVSDDAGNNPAPFLGAPSEESEILGLIDDIWAQAGIDVEFLPTTTYDSSFALTGTSDPRPTSDLNTIVSNASSVPGVLSADPNVINMFFVQIVPGFSQTSDNTANGLAFVGGNGVAQWAGPNLTGFEGGREVIASVIAHEIGHNLGLDHITETENLMQEGGAPNQGERLNSSQIATALASNFSVAVPEPKFPALLALIFAVHLGFRRRAR